MALVLMAEDENGKKIAASFMGRFRLKDGEYFLWRGKKPPFSIREEWLERIKPVPPDIDFLGNAEFALTLYCDKVEEAEGALVDTGLQWPDAID